MVAVLDGTGEDGNATTEDLSGLASSVDNAFAFIQDTGAAMYYSGQANIYLVAPGGQIVATGEYASDIPAETIEQYLE
ncbi:MAG: hypothetical protein ABIO70_02455 [Pseudomonadota bacterium]